jgi:hypothetical protein
LRIARRSTPRPAVRTALARNLSGFFVAKADLGPATNTQEMIDALRLDYDGSPFSGLRGHVTIETKMTPAIQGQTRIPKNRGFATGSPGECVENLAFPNTGNGMIPSRDGRLRPEWRLPRNPDGSSVRVPMPAEQTVMKFKGADGSPQAITVGGRTASTWKLVPDASTESGYRWDPL